VSAVDLGALEEFADAVAVRREVGALALVLVRLGGNVYALEDRCSHEEFPLSLGEVDPVTCEIECERHGALFHLADGSPASLPATKPVASYAVTVRDGRVVVVVP
jgi:3-phenylpropionate/trans-cinnamate dioxygenase ferredoxin subunit